MPAGVQLFNGQRLLQARRARGLTSVTLSSLADVSPSSISLYEKGTQKPQQSVLEELARALNVPQGFFFNGLRIDRPETPFYRSMSSATKAARLRAEAQYEWTVEVVDYLLQFFDFPELRLPTLDVPNDFRHLNTMHIELLAAQLRAHWTLGDGPVASMVRTLESNGIVVWRTALEADTLDAFSEYRLPHPVVVLSSDKENYFRSRFDAAHELGHLILHRQVKPSNLNKPSDFKLLEDQAHIFAGAFLLPATSYTSDLWSPSIDAFRSLKPKWNVTIAMQVMRCRQLGLITEGQEKRLWINLARRKWRRKEPLDDVTIPEKPNLIGKSIRMLVEENVKSKAQLVQDLALAPTDIEKIGELPFGYLRDLSGSTSPQLKHRSTKVLPFRR